MNTPPPTTTLTKHTCYYAETIEYLAMDSGGNVSDLVFARNCCMAIMLPREAELVPE